MATVVLMHRFCSSDQMNPPAFPEASLSAIPSRKIPLFPRKCLAFPTRKNLAKVGVEGSNPFARSN
jgi:hypothetical protein